MTAKVRNLAASIALVAISTALTLLALEGVFRIAAPQDAVLWVDSTIDMIEPAGADTPYRGDPDLGLTLKPSVRYRNEAPEFSILVESNSLGYRWPEFPAALEYAGTPAVVVTGDSFAWGHGVEAPESVPALLAKAKTEFAWFNLAVPGTGTDQHLLHYRKQGKALKPAVVVEFVYPNDLIDNLRSFRYFPKPRFDLAPDGTLNLVPAPIGAPPPSNPALPVDRFLRNRSHLYAFLKGRLMAFKAGSGEVAGRTEDVIGFYRRERTPEMENSLKLLKAILSQYVREVRADGAEFALVIVPHKWEMNTSGRYIKDDWATTVKLLGLNLELFDLDAFSRELSAWAASENVPCLDLLPLLRPLETGATRVYFPRDGHWTREGNRLVAELFLNQLWPFVSGGLLPGKGEGQSPQEKH